MWDKAQKSDYINQWNKVFLGASGQSQRYR